MSTISLIRTPTPSFVPSGLHGETEPRASPAAPTPQDSSRNAEHASLAGAPRRLDGQLTQARFEQAALRYKRENSSASTGHSAEAERAGRSFPQDVDARRADEKLQQTLIHWLITGDIKDQPFARNASIRPFIDALSNAAWAPQVQAWFKANGVDVATVRVFSDGVEGTVSVNGVKVRRRFTAADGSGWGEVGAKVTEAADKLSPDPFGVLLPGRKKAPFRDLDAVFHFYGVDPPHSDKERQPLGELLKSAGWPAITDEKRLFWRQQFGELQQKNADIDARLNLASQLQNLIRDAKEEGTLNLGDQPAMVQPESTLAQNSRLPRERFIAWLASPAFKTFIEKIGFGGGDNIYRVFEGDLEIRQRDTQWFSLGRMLQDEISKVGAGGSPAEKAAIRALEGGFKQLVEMTGPIGNTLYSQPVYDARQFLAFSGLGSPSTLAHIYSAITGLSNNLPPSPPHWTLPSSRPENPDRVSVDAAFGNDLLSSMHTGYSIVEVPQGTSMAAALDVYRHVLAQPELQSWFKSKGLETQGLRLHKDSISGFINRDGVRTAVTFSTADDSGWWQVSAKLRLIREVLDPADKGIYYLAEGESWVPTSVVLQAYGLPEPVWTGDRERLMTQLQTTGLVMPADQYRLISTRVEGVRQAIGDLDERAYLADYLENQVKNAPDDTPWDWSEEPVLPSASSPMVMGDHAARASLQRFTELPAVRTPLQRQGLFWPGQPFRVSEGKFEHRLPQGKWIDLSSRLTGERGIDLELRHLVNMSQSRGNALYSVPYYDIRQMLDHKGLGSPRTAGETRNMVRWLRSALPPAPALGDYSGLLQAPWSPGQLTPSDKATLKAQAGERLSGSAVSRFNYLGQTTLEALQQHPAEHLEKFLGSPDALNFGDDLAYVLKWRESPTPQTVRQQLAVAALTLHAEPDGPAAPGYIGGYSLYQPGNMGRTLTAVRRDLEKHLQLERGLEPKLAVLAAQIRLAQVAPEFLVQEVPKEIRIGTPAWMELRLGCEMAELKAPGTSRMMNEAHISDLAALAPTSEAQATLMQLGAMKILLDWAVLNGVIPAAAGGEHPRSAINRASQAFFKQRQEVNDAMNAVAEVPARKAIALRELLKVFAPSTPSQLEGMKVLIADVSARRNLPISEPRTRSLVETYMTGDLIPGKWVLRSDMPQRLVRPRSSPYQLNLDVEAPADKRAELDERIRRLPDLKALLKTAVDAHTATLKKAYATQLKLMFAKLPLPDRQLLNNPESVVRLFTVRGETGLPPVKQTEADKEAVRGRQGTLMRVELGKAVCYFEVFANGKITKRTDLPNNLRLGDVLAGKPNPLGLSGIYTTAFTAGFELNVDFDAYLKGTVPRPNVSSRVIVESIGNPIVGDTPAAGGAVGSVITDTFASAKTQRIVTLIAERNLYESDDALLQRAEGTLPLEKKREVLGRDKAILKGLVPFVGAYQEFADGNIGKGLFALSLDVGGLVIGAGGQARSLLRTAKTLTPNPVGGLVRRLGSTVAPARPKIAWTKPVASFGDRAFNFVKESALFSSAVMNPADGYAQLVNAAIKGLFKLSHLAPSASMLGKAAPHLLTVEEKLRAYWLAGGWDPAPAPAPTGVAGTSQGVAVVASRVNGFWYAINPKTGRADATPLPDFKSTTPLAV